MAWHFVLRNEYVFRCLNVDPPMMHSSSGGGVMGGVMDPITGHTGHAFGYDSGQSTPNKSNDNKSPRGSIYNNNNNGMNVDLSTSPAASSPMNNRNFISSRNNFYNLMTFNNFYADLIH